MEIKVQHCSFYFEKFYDQEYKEEYCKCKCRLILFSVEEVKSFDKYIEGRFMRSKESAIDSLVKENLDLVKFFVMRLRGLESESIEFNFKEDTK